MTFKKLEDIEVWHLARNLENRIFRLTLEAPFSRDFGLKDQINRSSGSVMDNIAEGFGRGGNIEFIQFLSFSRGSNEELRSQLYRAYDRGYVIDSTFRELQAETIAISVKLSNLMSLLRKSSFRGKKFDR